METAMTSRILLSLTMCVVLGLGSASQAQAHIITVAELPAGYANAFIHPTARSPLLLRISS